MFKISLKPEEPTTRDSYARLIINTLADQPQNTNTRDQLLAQTLETVVEVFEFVFLTTLENSCLLGEGRRGLTRDK